MTKAVFTTKIDPTYDDLPEVRYHFPRTYLRQAESAIGDWIVYYEPRRASGDLSSRGGRQAYFATAKVVSRPFREAAFAIGVKEAYANTCAMTGLKIINGGGRAEVQAAHIRPVAHQGSDSIRNGLARSSTIHWMFDRGLVSIDEDYTILSARDRLPDAVTRMLRQKLFRPNRTDQRPHPHFLRYHRDQIFKG